MAVIEGAWWAFRFTSRLIEKYSLKCPSFYLPTNPFLMHIKFAG
jgi:hypothetical protein